MSECECEGIVDVNAEVKETSYYEQYRFYGDQMSELRGLQQQRRSRIESF